MDQIISTDLGVSSRKTQFY